MSLREPVANLELQWRARPPSAFEGSPKHLWHRLFCFGGDPRSNPIHILSYVLIVAGFFLLSAAWRVLFTAQQAAPLATAGPYARVRHSQYIGFIAIISNAQHDQERGTSD